MKTYIKPQTNVQNIAMSNMVCTSNVTVDNEKQTVVGAAKERDVWSDGFWN